jgi:hypothetical protein
MGVFPTNLPASLTKTITIPTNIPFPLAGGLKGDAGTVQFDVCSELLNYSAPVSAFQANGKLGLIRDRCAQPMLFTLGNDQVCHSEPLSRVCKI